MLNSASVSKYDYDAGDPLTNNALNSSLQVPCLNLLLILERWNLVNEIICLYLNYYFNFCTNSFNGCVC